jgi:hypothetical protein
MMPIQTDSSLDQLATAANRFVMFTEIHGESESKRRNVWVNPSSVTHVTEYVPWVRDGAQPQRHSFIHFGAENWIHVEEGPIYVVACIQEAM